MCNRVHYKQKNAWLKPEKWHRKKRKAIKIKELANLNSYD